MKEVLCACASDVGQVRDYNEDKCFIDPLDKLFIVADGMGGHECGEVASSLAIESITKDVKDGISLSNALIRSHHAIIEAGKDGRGKEGMGCTIVTLRIQDDRYEVSWVGDSRAYHWNGKLQQLTRDHSYVQKLIDTGVLKQEEAQDHPERNVVTQALGATDLDNVSVDSISGRSHPGEKFLLCSDGLTGKLSDEEIGSVLARDLTEKECVTELIRLANEHGGEDNITAVLVSIPSQMPARSMRGNTRHINTRLLDDLIETKQRSHKLRWFVVVAILLVIVVVIYLGYQLKSYRETEPGQSSGSLLPAPQQSPEPVSTPDSPQPSSKTKETPSTTALTEVTAEKPESIEVVSEIKEPEEPLPEDLLSPNNEKLDVDVPTNNTEPPKLATNFK